MLQDLCDTYYRHQKLSYFDIYRAPNKLHQNWEFSYRSQKIHIKARKSHIKAGKFLSRLENAYQGRKLNIKVGNYMLSQQNHEIFHEIHHIQVICRLNCKMRRKERLLRNMPQNPKRNCKTKAFLPPKTPPQASLQASLKIYRSILGLIFGFLTNQARKSNYKLKFVSPISLPMVQPLSKKRERLLVLFYKIKTKNSLGQ